MNRDAAFEIVSLLKRSGKTISAAESFTAGRVSSAIITVPGASAVFHEGIVAYSNAAKISRLNVSETTLGRFGAVSRECCGEMLAGLLAAGGCDFAVATTGIAGPASDDTKKPVGLCYIGVADEKKQKIEELHLDGSREEITASAVNKALSLILSFIKE